MLTTVLLNEHPEFLCFQTYETFAGREFSRDRIIYLYYYIFFLNEIPEEPRSTDNT